MILTKKIFNILLYIMALIGLVFCLVFVGMQFGLFNVKGSIDNRNKFFTEDNNLQLITKIQSGFRQNMETVRKSVFPDVSFAWIKTEEWQTLSSALTKDREVIRRAADTASISPRILVAVVIAEQIRFFTSDRENFKRVFEPLKMLGTLSQFSLGVSGIKPDTAKLIEQNLKNQNSQFYISKEYEHLLDYKNDSSINSNLDASTSDNIYNRLTDEHNHYYSYLYTALFIKEVEAQWLRAGYDISNRPEILATIFNLGFDKSVPKKDPEVAGSIINIVGEKISFGRLAYEFYYSDELLEEFPR
ncbi:MAG: hypothetical protein WCO09_01385 [bacterium]